MKCRLCVQQGRPRPNKAMENGGNGLCSVHYRRKLAYRGEPQGWVPVDNVRTHLTKLKRAGMPMVRVAALVGMNEDSIRKIVNGKRERIQAATAKKILAINSPVEVAGELTEQSHVLGVGTARRIQSLVAIGYTQQYIADQVGLTRTGVVRIVGGYHKRVHHRTAELVAELFNRLNVTPAPDSPDARRAKSIARRHGWPLPFAWDEDEIDNPKAKPHVREVRAVTTKPDWYLEYEDLKDMGFTNQQVADRMGIHRDTLQKRLERLRRAA